MHFWLTQALSQEHSDERTHSGRQPGGLPTKLAKHVQAAIPLLSLHWLFGPHGLGRQTSITSIGGFAILNTDGEVIDKQWESSCDERVGEESTYDHIELRCNSYTNHLWTRFYRYTLADDLQLDNQHFDHRHQGMDQHIYFEHKLCSRDSRCSMNIRACNRRTDFRNIRANIDRNQYRFVHDKWHSLHMVMEHKDFPDLFGSFLEQNIGQMHRQHSPEYIHRLPNDLQHDILHSNHKCSIHMGFCSVD